MLFNNEARRQSVEETDELVFTSPESTLRSLIRELSFWEGVPSQIEYHSAKIKGKKQKLLPNKLDVKDNEREGASAKGVESSKDMNYLTNCRRKSGGGSTSSSPKPIWKAALDPTTGRTYYYDAVTRKTQWEKPPEIRAAEKRKKAERRKKDIKFFREMEQNLLASLRRGELIPGVSAASVGRTGPPQDNPRTPDVPSPVPHSGVPASRVRTLSTMDGDDGLLAELRIDGSIPQHRGTYAKSAPPTVSTATVTSSKMTLPPSSSNSAKNRSAGRPPLPQYQQPHQHQHHQQRQVFTTMDSMELSPDVTECGRPNSSPSRGESAETLAGEKFLDGPIHEAPLSRTTSESSNPPPSHVRRNTGGTIYMKTSMTNPDVKATIKCVCGVYRAHIVQAFHRRTKNSPTSVMTHPSELDIFMDNTDCTDNNSTRKQKNKASKRDDSPSLPSLSDIMTFYQEFYSRSQMEHDTIIMSLIYVERLIKETSGAMTPMVDNWRSILFACMVLASKVWDDLSMWNIDFSNVSASSTQGLSAFTLKRINQLELGLLKLLKFDVKVPASEYAKYYFLIRTMLLRSGCLSETEMKPIGKEDARRLENKTFRYQDSKLKNRGSRRTRSLDDWSWLSANQVAEDNAECPVLKDKVCLEQLVSMKG